MKRDDPRYRKYLSNRVKKWWKENKYRHPWANAHYGNIENSIKSGYKLPCK